MAESVVGSAGTYRQLVINRLPRVVKVLKGLSPEASADEVLVSVEAELRDILGLASAKKKSKKAE